MTQSTLRNASKKSVPWLQCFCSLHLSLPVLLLITKMTLNIVQNSSVKILTVARCSSRSQWQPSANQSPHERGIISGFIKYTLQRSSEQADIQLAWNPSTCMSTSLRLHKGTFTVSPPPPSPSPPPRSPSCNGPRFPFRRLSSKCFLEEIPIRTASGSNKQEFLWIIWICSCPDAFVL